MPATKATTAPGRWNREDVILLLSFLNFHTYKIQQELLEEEKHGMGYATEILSDCLSEDCTPARVARKLYAIWDAKGAEGSKLVDLYRHGACQRTLPFLDEGILQEVARNVKEMQKSSSDKRGEAKALLESDNIRRSKRRVLNNIDSHPIECRCTFSHMGSSCIHCDGCPTWQHKFCYYGNDTENPKTHFCDVCTGVKPAISWKGESISMSAQEDFIKSMRKLEIRFDDVDSRMAKKLTAHVDDDETEKLAGKFDLPRDDEVPWGLEDSEISGVFQLIGYQIRRLADSFPVNHFSTCKLSSKFLEAKEELKALLDIVFGESVEKKFKSVFKKKSDFDKTSSSFFSALISAAVQEWVFYSPVSEVPSFKTLSFDTQQRVILAKYGMRTLKNVHRATWASLMYENPEHIKPIIAREAEHLTRRFFQTVEPLVIPTDAVKNNPVIEDWINSTQDGKSRNLVISQVFTAALKLKARLPLTEQYYEIFSPVLGTPFSRNLMAVEGEDVMDMDIVDHSASQFCIMFGIIEQPTSAIRTKRDGVEELFGPHNFVRPTGFNQGTERVVCPAIITL